MNAADYLMILNLFSFVMVIIMTSAYFKQSPIIRVLPGRYPLLNQQLIGFFSAFVLLLLYSCIYQRTDIFDPYKEFLPSKAVTTTFVFLLGPVIAILANYQRNFDQFGLELAPTRIQRNIMVACVVYSFISIYFVKQITDEQLHVPLAIVGAIMQEFVFRGFLQNRLEGALGDTRGLLASSIIFGLYHLNFDFSLLSQENGRKMLSATLLGLCFGIIFQRTRSLWLVGLLHVAYNLSR